MRIRCNNKNDQHFAHYGGRGIRVCERWSDYANFIADMGSRPSPKHSIDRIDVNGHYEPGNCRWATQKEQCQNKRNNVIMEYNGVCKTIAQWADDLGIDYGTLSARRLRGWSDEKAITTPKGKREPKAGKDHHRSTAKMTEADVAEARVLYASGVSQRVIGRMYGVHQATISHLVRGSTWRHVA